MMKQAELITFTYMRSQLISIKTNIEFSPIGLEGDRITGVIVLDIEWFNDVKKPATAMSTWHNGLIKSVYGPSKLLQKTQHISTSQLVDYHYYDYHISVLSILRSAISWSKPGPGVYQLSINPGNDVLYSINQRVLIISYNRSIHEFLRSSILSKTPGQICVVCNINGHITWSCRHKRRINLAKLYYELWLPCRVLSAHISVRDVKIVILKLYFQLFSRYKERLENCVENM